VLGFAAAVGALTAPLIAGQLADRYFRTERVLAVLLVLGGVIKIYTSFQTSYAAWLVLTIAFSVVYVPTLSLANSICFHHIKDSQRNFPYIRVWGTIGFIAAMWAFPMIYLQENLHFQWMPPFLEGDNLPEPTKLLVKSLQLAGIISLVYAAFCFCLPTTPPVRDAKSKFAFAKAFAMFKKPSFLVLLVITVPIATLHYLYWMKTPQFLGFLGIHPSKIGPAISVGQFSEIFMMGLLGLVMKRVGARWVITMGCLAYGMRFVFFGIYEDMPLWGIVLSQALHGVCAAAFFAAAFIYVDRLADDDVRHSAQTVFSLILFGLGLIIAGQWFPVFSEWSTNEASFFSYKYFWNLLSIIGLVSTLAFFVLFRDETRAKPGDQAPETPTA